MKASLKPLALALTIALPAPAMAIAIIPTNDANVLTNNILGAGVTLIGTPTYIGVTNQSGTFTGGLASGIGFDQGIVLSTGNVQQIPGPNNTLGENVGSLDTIPPDDDVSTDLKQSGDSDLTVIVGDNTFDAAVLNFQFQIGDGSAGGSLFFNFVFASEEYVDYIGTQFNDVFALFVDGVDIAPYAPT